MRWIKCSERLPVSDGTYEQNIIFRSNDHLKITMITPLLTPNIPALFDLKDYEWLDESTPPSSPERTEGSHYYNLFKFFNEEHNLILLDSQIQDILHEVENWMIKNGSLYTPEYQNCPKCNGQGTVAKPPYVPGDVFEWSGSTATTFVCDVCNGAKIIPKFPYVPQNSNANIEKEPPDELN